MLEEAHGPVKTFRHAYTQRIQTIRKRAEPSRVEASRAKQEHSPFCTFYQLFHYGVVVVVIVACLRFFSPDLLSNDDLHNCCSALFLFLFILSHTQSISAERWISHSNIPNLWQPNNGKDVIIQIRNNNTTNNYNLQHKHSNEYQ